MIGHFLRRDFRDSRLGWIIVLAATVSAIAGSVAAGPSTQIGGLGLTALGYTYLIFGMSAGPVLGSVGRSQQQLSRHYLTMPCGWRRW